MSPAPVELSIGPQEIDGSEGFGQVGAGQTAKLLIQAHARANPPELTAKLAMPRVEDATKVIQDGLEEVSRVAKPNGDVEGAQVLGDKARPETWVVAYVYRVESGRSARGIVSWSKLSDAPAEFERRRQHDLLGTSFAARAEGEVAPHDPDRARAQEEEIERLRNEIEQLQDPPPYEGYGEETVKDVKEHLDGLDLTDPEDYTHASQLLEYERRHQDRNGITQKAEKLLKAADESREAAEASSSED